MGRESGSSQPVSHQLREPSTEMATKKALGYGRVSTVKQVVDGVSLEAQRMEITSFAIATGYDLLDVLCDDGISGSKNEDERPGLAELLTAVREGTVTVVIVCKRDRLARDQALAGHIETVIRRAGAELISIDEAGLNPITKAVLTMVAEVERLLAAQRTRFAMRALKLKGKTFGTVPFGYRRNADGGLDSESGEIEVVYEIAAMRRTGATLAAIALHLTNSGVPTRRGGKWSPEQVRSILARAEMHGLPQLPATAA
jgi:site-specific DNA recombinase